MKGVGLGRLVVFDGVTGWGGGGGSVWFGDGRKKEPV